MSRASSATDVARARAWQARNPLRVAEIDAKRRMTHRSELAAAARAYRAANPGYKEAARSWRSRNPDRTAANGAAKKARKRGARCDSPAAMRAWVALLRLAGCEYCGAPYEHLEHMTPLGRGGSHTIRNTTGSCARCNLNKHGKVYPDEWPTDFKRVGGTYEVLLGERKTV